MAHWGGEKKEKHLYFNEELKHLNVFSLKQIKIA